MTRIAIMGFRHPHIFDLHKRIAEHADLEIAACCEEDASTREDLVNNKGIEIAYDDYEKLLSEVECDAVAVGDYYEKRGGIIIAALKAGKHVISDKPMCTRLSELDEITKLSSDGSLKLGCMFDLRDSAVFISAKKVIDEGKLGEVHSIQFGGQHPLNRENRASWYFEEGKHGGSLNDVGVHGFDIIPWMTGKQLSEVSFAREWNAYASGDPHFMDSAQVVLKLDNDAGVMGDVSYATPDSHGYSLPFYWRFTVWGSQGMMEFGYNIKDITLAQNGSKEVESVPLGEGKPGGYLKAFIDDIQGREPEGGFDTRQVIASTRQSLLIQKAADEGLTNQSLG